jgi:hypothetical protein
MGRAGVSGPNEQRPIGLGVCGSVGDRTLENLSIWN